MTSGEEKHRTMVTSKKFCAISGITMETLRHYIDRELVKPAKVLANGYREFSIDNAVDVFYLRHERGLGACLNRFHPENEATSLADQDARYEENLLQLQKQKALLERQIERNLYFKNLIQRAIHQKDQILYLNVEQLFSLSFLEFSHGNLDRQDILEMIEKWMQYPELLHLAFRIDPAQLTSNSDSVTPRVGLGIRTDFAQQYELPYAEAETSCGSGKMAMVVSRSESLTQIPKTTLTSLLACTDKPIRTVLVGRLITRVQEEGKLWYYFSCCLDL